MIRLISALFCALGIWQLFRWGREEGVRTSPVLWVPTVWLFLGATRNPSEWLQLSAPSGQSSTYLEGNPLDQVVLSSLLAFALIVAFSRGRQVLRILQSNIPILLYFLYCGISVLWSDFPDVAFKRWFRAVGDLLMVLVVLSDPNWAAATRRVLSRVAFVAMPVSILFIRYFPEWGRAYSRGGLIAWCGVATGKNSLGIICLVFGLAALFWFLQTYREEKGSRKFGQFISYGATAAMAIYLVIKCQSATSFACFLLAGIPMALALLFPSARKAAFVHVMVLAILGLTISALFLNANGGMVEELGRDATLTGRTDIWRSAFSLVQNPVVGTGFESFWVGPRLTQMESLVHQQINQAHDGYIEVYLNLGWVGIAFLASLLIAGYGCVIRNLRLKTPLACLGLACFIAMTAYNCTEAAIKMMSPLWITFLLLTMARPDALIPNTPSKLSDSDLDNRLVGSQRPTKLTVGTPA